MAQRPLMLKDFLELDWNAGPSDGFHRAVPPQPESASTIRRLLETELGSGRLIRTRSKGAVTKITAAIKAVKLFSTSASSSRLNDGRFLSISLPKKLRRRFWKPKRSDGDDQMEDGIVGRLRSLDAEENERRSVHFPSEAESEPSSASFDSVGEGGAVGEGGGAGAGDEDSASSPRVLQESEIEGMNCTTCQPVEEKDQLSPVSVMEFPCEEEEDRGDDDDEDDDVAVFEQTLANIERAREQLLQKIRRFESLAELEPTDLDERFASIEETDGPTTCHVVSPDEPLRQPRAPSSRGPHGRGTEKAVLVGSLVGRGDAGSKGWMVDNWGREQIEEMERDGRWRFVGGEDEAAAAADVESGVLALLMEELLLDLVFC